MINFYVFLVFYTAGITAKIYFKEEFSDDDWQKRWVVSEHPSRDWGKFVLTTGRYYGDRIISKGIQTSSKDGKFYALSTKFEPFSNEGKILVIQYTVKHEQEIKCGGAYIKLFDCTLNPEKFHSYKPYLIQFGPDICVFKKIHVIFTYEDRKLAMKRELSCIDDRLTHLYTLIIKPDNSYLVKIDNKIKRRGRLEEDWDFLPSKIINDTKIAKSLDKKDSLKITVSTNEKAQDYQQTNPDFHFNSSEKEQKEYEKKTMIKNTADNEEWKLQPTGKPNYRRQGIEPFPENTFHHSDSVFYKYDEICGIGFDIWQSESGTLFDNILITDDEFEAEKHGNDTWGAIKEMEKLMKIKFDKNKTNRRTRVLDPEYYHDEL